MSNYVEYNDKVAFHPGYYIKEIVDESGLTQEDFAKRLDTTPKNLSLLVRGEQSLSIDIAMKLSRLLGTSVQYWLNLQNAYDALIAEFKSQKELEEERVIFEYLDYKYFKDNYGLPDYPRQKDEQIKALRMFLNVSSLTVLGKRDMAVSFGNASKDLSQSNTIKANTMVQIATNKALKEDAPKFSKKKFQEAVEYARKNEDSYADIKKTFLSAGVIFEMLPGMAGAKIKGATKKLSKNIVLMLNDGKQNSDSLWDALLHEIAHIMNGDFEITFDEEQDKVLY